MANKIKIARSFIFKAYKCDKNDEVVTSCHMGEFFTKSECHYYCEKDVLDYFRNSQNESEKMLIYKISTIEDTNIEDMLIETIQIKEGKINID